MSGRDAIQLACRHCGLPAEGTAAPALQVDEQGRTECWCGEHDDRVGQNPTPCPECDGDGYVDLFDEDGFVIGPGPCPRGCEVTE